MRKQRFLTESLRLPSFGHISSHRKGAADLGFVLNTLKAVGDLPNSKSLHLFIYLFFKSRLPPLLFLYILSFSCTPLSPTNSLPNFHIYLAFIFKFVTHSQTAYFRTLASHQLPSSTCIFVFRRSVFFYYYFLAFSLLRTLLGVVWCVGMD